MNSVANKKIFVTGGTGFVGSHLVEALVKQNAQVITTYMSLDPRSYFMKQGLDKKVTMVPLDITEFDKVFDIITKLEVDFIFHLAAQPLVEAAYYNPRRTLDSNIRGTINILEAARLYPRVKGIIFASSDKAYGKLKAGKYEESFPLKGDHPYEVSKSAADLIVQSYFKTYKLPIVITRFGNIYGEGDLNFSRIIPGIMESVVKKQDLILRSDGTFIRDYLYVKDVAAGYITLLNKIDKVVGESFNFGSDDTLSVTDLIKEAEKALDTKVSFKIQNTTKNEIPYQSLNYTKIMKMVGWKPQWNLQKSLPEILLWYKSIL